MKIFAAGLALACAASAASADVIHLANGGKLEGLVIRESDASYVIRLKYATVTLSKSDVASIEKTRTEEKAAAARLAAWEAAIQAVAARPWAGDLRQVPATVIDKGILKNVPYMSHKSGDYEFNIYGDPDHPAGIEIGIYRELLKSESAKKECLAVMKALLSDAKDREVLVGLARAQDKQEREGLTFEVTPETADDAYGGWWISIYDAKALDAARATDKELEAITTTDEEVAKEDKDEEERRKTEPKAEPPKKDPKAEPPKTPPPNPDYLLWQLHRWGHPDLKFARPAPKTQTVRRVYLRGVYRSGGSYVRPSFGGRRK